ncbi:MAG: thiamine pyrophosphate-binding protein [Chloroflexi bacterium]|nr:thiamine pyrophosphate-binding protein [Chloroflexota bacterium]
MLIDHQALFAPLTKASYRFEEGHVADVLARALALALAEPPGPVHLELPEDVGVAEASERPIEAAPKLAPDPAPAGVAEEVRRLLEASRRPLVVTGLTFTRSAARDQLLRFIETQRLPFVTTMHAKGFLPESHPACLGVMGRARRTDVQRMIEEADLLLAVGFDPVEIDYEEWAGRTPVAHLSTEPVQPGTDANVVYEGVGGLDGTLAALAELEPVENRWDPDAWNAHRTALAAALRPKSAGMAAYHVIDVLRDVLPADAILAYDVGAHTHQIATQWSTDLPHTAVSTNGWSSMGYGMPAAYAAKLAHPGRTVLALVGDGCFQMTVGELATAARLGLAVPTVVLNDGWLGLMKVKQERLGYGSSGAVLGEQAEPPAHYFGVPVRAARDEGALRSALAWALGLDGPSVIEAFIDVGPYSETVFDQ